MSVTNIILDYYYVIQFYNKYRQVITFCDKHFKPTKDGGFTFKDSNCTDYGEILYNYKRCYNYGSNYYKICNITFKQSSLTFYDSIKRPYNIIDTGFTVPKRYVYTWPNVKDLRNYLFN